MALGFTSHYSNSEQPFGSLILSNTESETAGSVAYSDDASSIVSSLLSSGSYDSCEFSVSVNIDYSQYASYVASGSTETAGSVAFSGGSFSSGGSTCSSGASFSGGGGCSSSGGGCSASFTC
ncbi:MAG: hypothetical protein NC200_00030 [Candidatus Gastranaerophilales bacterium]|nr:hypothetical protein [Candidatus Gastranaerophilales bacterium]